MGSFNVGGAASMVRNQENSDYILNEYEKCRKVRINFAQRTEICGEKSREKVEMDYEGQRLEKRPPTTW